MNDCQAEPTDIAFQTARPLPFQGVDAERRPSRPSNLAGLSGSGLSDRFCFWRGRSGRRYVFSIYRTGDTDETAVPRYSEAVMIAARRGSDGGRSILRVGRTGALPGLVVSSSERDERFDEDADELHFHLLAGDNAEREAIVSDLAEASD